MQTAQPVEVVDLQRHLGFVSDCQEVQHGVGGAAHRQNDGDGVLQRLARQDVPSRDPLLLEVLESSPNAESRLVDARVDGRDGGGPGEGQPQRLDGRGHGVRRIEGCAGARAGAGHPLQGDELFQGGFSCRQLTVGLVHVLDGDVSTLVAAGHDRAAVEEDGRDVQPGDGHHSPGHVFVAPTDDDEAVHALCEAHGLNGVGNDLAAHQGALHPLGAHGDGVANGDCPEEEGDAARGPDPLLGLLRQAGEVDIAGGDVRGQVGHGHEGLVHVVVVQARGPQHGPSARPLGTVRDHMTARLESAEQLRTHRGLLEGLGEILAHFARPEQERSRRGLVDKASGCLL